MICIGLLLLLPSCNEDAKHRDKHEQILWKMLELDEVAGVKDIAFTGKTITVIYEASEADDYDTQLIANWGSIFGAGANFPYEEIAIITTVNDVPYTKLTASQQLVLAYVHGDISDTQFWENVEFESLE